MAMAPSPTAEATRFTDPLRTSPTANTPGRLVSSRRGRGTAPGLPSPAAPCTARGAPGGTPLAVRLLYGDGVLLVRDGVRPGDHEAAVVEPQVVAQPGGARLRADEDEQLLNRHPLAFAGPGLLHLDGGQRALLPLQGTHLRAQP